MTNPGKASRFTIVRLEERIAPGAMSCYNPCGGNGSSHKKSSKKGSKKSSKKCKKSSKKGSSKKGKCK